MAFDLAGVFSTTRAAPADGANAASSAPVVGSGDEVSANLAARVLALAIFVAGLVLAWLMPEDKAPFRATDGFILLTGFYVAAQAIERALELMLPIGKGTKQCKANRSIVFSAIAFGLAVLLAEYLGLYFLQAVGAPAVSGDLDVVVTALAIGGGTKPLHDFIKSIEKAKQNPPATH